MNPDWPGDFDVKPNDVAWWMNAVDSAKTFGNTYFMVCSALLCYALFYFMFYNVLVILLICFCHIQYFVF